MRSARLRMFLGVYAPLILGAFVILFAINFLAFTTAGPGPYWPEGFSWDAWRVVCAGGLIFVGVILGISTYGRYRKTKAARLEAQGAVKPPPPPCS